MRFHIPDPVYKPLFVEIEFTQNNKLYSIVPACFIYVVVGSATIANLIYHPQRPLDNRSTVDNSH